MLERHVGRHVLDEQRLAEEILGFADLARQQFHGFVGVGQRQQIVEILAAGVAPAGVLGNQRGFEAGDGALHAREVLAIDAVGGPQSKPDAMQAEWVVSARALERARRRAALVKIVFGVRFDPADGRTLSERARRDERPEDRFRHAPESAPAAHLVIRGVSCGRYIAFFSDDLAAHLFALAFRHVLPLVGGLVGLGLARAGMLSGGAVVLAGFGDAQALFLGGASSAETVALPSASRLPTAEAMAMVFRFM